MTALVGVAGLYFTGNALHIALREKDRHAHVGLMQVEIEHRVESCNQLPISNADVTLGGVHAVTNEQGSMFLPWRFVDDAALTSLQAGPTRLKVLDAAGNIRLLALDSETTNSLAWGASAVLAQRAEDDAERGAEAQRAALEAAIQETAAQINAERARLGIARTPSSPTKAPAVACCKICEGGKACGNTCIASWKECHTLPGCACDAE
jgi:hypothetical protein